MFRKGCLTSPFFSCTLQLCRWDTWHREKPLFTTRDLWHSQKWKGNDSWCLESLCSSHPTQPPGKLWAAFWPLLQKKKIHLSQVSQVTPLFLGLLEDAAIFPFHPQMRNSAESWRPCSVLLSKWDLCCGTGVFLELSTSSLQWLGCLAVKDQPFYLLLLVRCFFSTTGNVLEDWCNPRQDQTQDFEVTDTENKLIQAFILQLIPKEAKGSCIWWGSAMCSLPEKKLDSLAHAWLLLEWRLGHEEDEGFSCLCLTLQMYVQMSTCSSSSKGIAELSCVLHYFLFMTKWTLDSFVINSWACVENDKFQPVHKVINDQIIILDGKAWLQDCSMERHYAL